MAATTLSISLLPTHYIVMQLGVVTNKKCDLANFFPLFHLSVFGDQLFWAPTKTAGASRKAEQKFFFWGGRNGSIAFLKNTDFWKW